MSRYLVDGVHYTHTCPADPTPHPFNMHRTVVGHTPGGQCRRPIPVRNGGRMTMVDCARLLAPHRCCPACTTIVEIRQEATVHVGPYRAPTRGVPVGYAPHPCIVCGQPLAAVLADGGGRHVLCDPPPHRGRR
jgi:hypothetical protein